MHTVATCAPVPQPTCLPGKTHVKGVTVPWDMSDGLCEPHIHKHNCGSECHARKAPLMQLLVVADGPHVNHQPSRYMIWERLWRAYEMFVAVAEWAAATHTNAEWGTILRVLKESLYHQQKDVVAFNRRVGLHPSLQSSKVCNAKVHKKGREAKPTSNWLHSRRCWTVSWCHRPTQTVQAHKVCVLWPVSVLVCEALNTDSHCLDHLSNSIIEHSNIKLVKMYM